MTTNNIRRCTQGTRVFRLGDEPGSQFFSRPSLALTSGVRTKDMQDLLYSLLPFYTRLILLSSWYDPSSVGHHRRADARCTDRVHRKRRGRDGERLLSTCNP